MDLPSYFDKLLRPANNVILALLDVRYISRSEPSMWLQCVCATFVSSEQAWSAHVQFTRAAIALHDFAILVQQAGFISGNTSADTSRVTLLAPAGLEYHTDLGHSPDLASISHRVDMAAEL